jgi:hypothetical protein
MTFLTLLPIAPILAYLLLLAAHAALLARHRPPTKRVILVIEAVIFAAYGLMVSFYAVEALVE